ncbi:MAG: glycosyltransferase family 4 protein [Luteibacter jiangsuensis]
MERLNLQLARELGRERPLDVVGPRGCGAVLPPGVRASECELKPLPRFLVESMVSALIAAFRFRPSLVLAGSGLCAPAAWLAGRLSQARVSVYLHGLDIVADSLVYRTFWLPFIRRCDICIVNSGNTAGLARAAGVRKEKIHVIHPGVELPTTLPGPDQVASFRAEKGWTNRKVLLSVGRLTERKGLADFVDRVLPRLVERDPDILLVVIGNDAPDALRRSRRSVRAAIKDIVAAHGLERYVSIHGEVDDHELEAAYASADVAIFPVQAIPGDVEGFGMVAIEAAAHGLPTVAYAVGGVPDAISHGDSGLLVAPGDSAGFEAAVIEVLRAGRGAFKERCLVFAQRFDWRLFGDRIRAVTGAVDAG